MAGQTKEQEEGPPERVSGRRRWRRRLALGAVVLVGLYLLREPLVHPLLARAVASLASTQGGQTLTIDEIDGDWFRTLGVRGVRLTSETAPLRKVTVRSAELRFSLWDLLRNRDLGSLGTLEIEGVRATVDLTAAPTAESSTGSAWPSVPGRLPAIEAKDIALDLRLTADAQLRFEQLQMHSSGSPGTRAIAVKTPLAQVNLGDQEWRGTADLNAISSADELRVEQFRAGPRRLADDVTIDWSDLAQRRLSWQATLADGQLTTEGLLDGTRLKGALTAQGADLSTWVSQLPAPLSTLGARLDVSSDFDVDLTDLSRGTASLELEARQISFGDIEASRIRLDARLEGGALSILEFAASQDDRNQLELSGLHLPLPVDDLASGLASASGRLAFDLSDLSRLSVPTKGPLPQHRIRGVGGIEAGSVAISEGVVDVPGGVLTIERGSIDLAASDPADRAIDVEAVVEFADLGPLAQLWGSEDYAGSLSGRVTLGGTLGQPSGHLSGMGRGVQLGKLDLGEVNLVVHASDGRVRLERMECAGALGTLSALGAFRIVDREFEALTVDARILELAPFGWVPAETLQLTDPLSVQASLNGALLRPTADLRVTAPATLIKGHPIEALELAAHFEGETLDLEQLSFASPWGTCTTAGTANIGKQSVFPVTLTLDKLSFVQGQSTLALANPAEALVDGSTFAISRFHLTGSAGDLRIEAQGNGNATTAHVQAERLNLVEFLVGMPVMLDGIDAEVSLDSAPGRLKVSSEGSIEHLQLEGMAETLSTAWKADLSDGRLRLEQSRIVSEGSTLLDWSADVPLDIGADPMLAEGALSIDGTLDVPGQWAARLPLPESMGTMAGSLHGEIRLEGGWAALRGDVRCEARDLSLSGPALADYFQQPASIDLDLKLQDKVAVSVHGTLPGIGELLGRAALESHLDLRQGISDPGKTLGALREAPLNGNLVVRVDSLARVTRSLTSIRRLEGRLLANAQVSGSLANPQLTGDATLAEGDVRLTSEMPALERLTAELHFDGKSLELVDVRAEMGAAPVTLRGRVDWEQGPLSLDLNIQGDELLLLRTPTARLRADTVLRMHGPLEQLHLEGKLGLRAARISQQIDLLPKVSSLAANDAVRANSRGFQLFSLNEPPLADMTLDLKIETIDPLTLTTNLASSSWTMDLNLRGTGKVPLPEGQIFMDNTRLKLPGGVMKFSAGRVLFSRANPFVPTLEMRGETQLAGYDVTMAVKGPYDDPEALLSSSPPLSNSDLLLLVVTGEPPAGDLRGSTQRAAQSLTLYLAKDILQRLSSPNLGDDDESLLDRLEVIQGRDISKSGTFTTEASFRLQKGILGDSDAFYLVADRDVYEQFNMGLRVVFRFR